MLHFPPIDPVFFRLGPVEVRWYGLAYLAAFAVGYALLKVRLKECGLKLAEGDGADLIVAMLIGVLIGGRLGYCLFYNPVYYLAHPLEVVYVFAGGRSFHGGLIGVAIAGYWFCRQKGYDFYRWADAFVPVVPIGLGLGRLGNFANGELWGRAAEVPWAMVFPLDPTHLPRHPSQLYEFFLEGVLLTALLWGVRKRKLPSGSIFWLFMAGYGLFRLIGECFREPDAHLSFLIPGVTAGMVVSLPMAVMGVAMLVILRRRESAKAEREQMAA